MNQCRDFIVEGSGTHKLAWYITKIGNIIEPKHVQTVPGYYYLSNLPYFEDSRIIICIIEVLIHVD